MCSRYSLRCRSWLILTISSLCFCLLFSRYLLILLSILFCPFEWQLRFIIIIIQMSKRTILVHCLHGLRPPFLYMHNYHAIKKCEKEPGYSITQCDNETQASQLFDIKMAEYQTALNKNRIAILKANLQKKSAMKSAQAAIPQQLKFIDQEQRIEREKKVNEIFRKHKFPHDLTFKSSPILVSPLIRYEGYFDGSSKKNPGYAAIGYLLKYLHTVLLKRGELVGHLTSNQAELTGMAYVLAHSYCNGVQHLEVIGDSQVSIEWMKNNYQTRNQNISSLVEGNKQLSSFFKSIKFKHVRRQLNKEADKLASDAFGRPSRKKKNQLPAS